MSWFKDFQKEAIGVIGAVVGATASIAASPVVVLGELIDGKSVEEAVNSAGTVIEDVTNDAAKFGHDHAEDIIETTGAVIGAAKFLYDVTKPKPPSHR